jgi:hypothetical protein
MTPIWITKYALTTGIKLATAETIACDGWTYIPWSNGRYYSKADYSLNPEEAIARARLMRDRKIASLKKQITKLEQMTFEVESK